MPNHGQAEILNLPSFASASSSANDPLPRASDRRNDSNLVRRSLGADTHLRAASPETQINEGNIPDGGYGWVVVTSCAVLTFWFVGTTYSWGVIQGALVQSGLSQASTLSFIGALTVSCISFLAIVNAKLVSVVGSQRCALFGVTLIGLGEILAGFSTNSVAGLFVTVGVIMGIGTRYILLLPRYPRFFGLISCTAYAS